MALRPACGVQSGAERMFLSGVAHQPIERTLLTGGLVEVRGHGLQMQSLWINPYCRCRLTGGWSRPASATAVLPICPLFTKSATKEMACRYIGQG